MLARTKGQSTAGAHEWIFKLFLPCTEWIKGERKHAGNKVCRQECISAWCCSKVFHFTSVKPGRSYFGHIESAEGHRSPCALMLERDMNEEGAFHQGRRNEEMKRKHVSNGLLLLIPAPWRLFVPLQNLWDCNKELC